MAVNDRDENRVLTYEVLSQAVAGNVAAVRSVTKLQPAGGEGDKVFPPTYQGGQYALERRRIGDEVVDTVLLDSVPSQANRMEQALKRAREGGYLRFPLMVSDFTPWFPDIAKITALDAPHRIADAIFRESLLDGVYFRVSDRGKRFVAARAANATVLLELCPTALVFGVWDSTGLGPRAGSGAKFQRAIVSEIVGIESETGVRTASRIDPLPISSLVDIYKSPGGEGWTSDPGKALQEKNKAVPFRGQEGRGRPSSINLGNVTPDVARNRRGDPLPGGVTIRCALQTTVLSLGALRRLCFPLADGIRSEQADAAARTLLAALALAAVAYQREEGYDLRSRCLLVPLEAPCVQLVPGDGQAPLSFSFGAEQARDAFAQAANEVKAAGLPWSEEEIVLQPSERLVALIQRSLEVGSPPEDEGSVAEEAE